MNKYKALIRENADLMYSDYLVEDLGEQFHIHRILSEDEAQHFSSEETCISLEGEYYLPKIAVCKTKEEAETAIQSYWSAIDQLCEISKSVVWPKQYPSTLNMSK